MSTQQTKKEEKTEQAFLQKHAIEPAKTSTEAKPTPPVEKTAQDVFNDKMKELSKTILELVNGADSLKAEQIKGVVDKTLKFAHGVKYHTAGLSFDPII